MYDMENHRYADIITRPHPVSNRRPHMSRINRAAQFAPFAALTGYEAAMMETARRTEERLTLTADAMALLDARLQVLIEHLSERPHVSVTCFVPDARKAGGAYETVSGCVRRIDEYEQLLLFTDGSAIPLKEICAMEGGIFEKMPTEG